MDPVIQGPCGDPHVPALIDFKDLVSKSLEALAGLRRGEVDWNGLGISRVDPQLVFEVFSGFFVMFFVQKIEFINHNDYSPSLLNGFLKNLDISLLEGLKTVQDY